MLCAATALPKAKTLEIYFVDVEGGQATLVVSPAKQALLIDTGWPGLNMRDANRIAAAAKRAGVRLYNRYVKARETGQHLEVKPGDKIPMKGLDVTVLTAAGQGIASALAGAGQPNPACAATKPLEADASENAQSVGILIQYGSFRMIDLGDLTWNKENELVCPVNKIGTVDLYLTTHHGMNISNSPAIVQALHPRVAVMNNGARKGGSPEAWQAVHDSPGLQDIWQVHYAMDGGKDHNSPEAMIANIYEQGDEANWLRVSADANGEITVYNSRNKYEKTYTK